jgi:hypothetical protein
MFGSETSKAYHATWHVGMCGVCGNIKAVTLPIHFGHLINDSYVTFEDPVDGDL